MLQPFDPLKKEKIQSIEVDENDFDSKKELIQSLLDQLDFAEVVSDRFHFSLRETDDLTLRITEIWEKILGQKVDYDQFYQMFQEAKQIESLVNKQLEFSMRETLKSHELIEQRIFKVFLLAKKNYIAEKSELQSELKKKYFIQVNEAYESVKKHCLLRYRNLYDLFEARRRCIKDKVSLFPSGAEFLDKIDRSRDDELTDVQRMLLEYSRNCVLEPSYPVIEKEKERPQRGRSFSDWIFNR